MGITGWTQLRSLALEDTMKHLLSIVMTLVALAGLITTTLSAAEEEGWQVAFTAALQEGKAGELPQGQSPAEGLAYTPPEELVLQEAVSEAMKQDAPACECMKIAIDLEYNPYAVLKSIYTAGGNIKLDQLCMCATEAGIMKAITAKAATDARWPSGLPVFHQDEIAQSQCLGGEEGLAYTPPDQPLKAIAADPNTNRNFATTTTF